MPDLHKARYDRLGLLRAQRVKFARLPHGDPVDESDLGHDRVADSHKATACAIVPGLHTKDDATDIAELLGYFDLVVGDLYPDIIERDGRI